MLRAIMNLSAALFYGAERFRDTQFPAEARALLQGLQFGRTTTAWTCCSPATITELTLPATRFRGVARRVVAHLIVAALRENAAHR